MNATVEQWEAAIADPWGRWDSFDRQDGLAAMREPAEACPAADGGAAVESTGQCGSALRS